MDILLDALFSDPDLWDAAVISGEAKHIKSSVLEDFTSPSYRTALKARIENSAYVIAPPHEAQVPKDDGTMRTVYANDARDRVLLSAVNALLFKLFPDMVHPACRSYLSGVGCGNTVREAAAYLQATPCPETGYKLDLSKYFDSVPIAYIDAAFDEIESRTGPSAVLDLLRTYYHDDTLLDLSRHKIHKYTSLRQGCAVAAFLADCVLKPVDAAVSGIPGTFYRRYSDDILILGPGADAAFEVCENMLASMGLALNPKKVERLVPDRWFTFLGFSLRADGGISLSKRRVKSFEKAVRERTVATGADSGAALRRVASWLYDCPYTPYGWAEGIFPVVNRKDDLWLLDAFLLDCLRACDTGRTKLGGLGWDAYSESGPVRRGTGRNVKENRAKRPRIEGYVPMPYMREVYLSSRPAYETYARAMRDGTVGEPVSNKTIKTLCKGGSVCSISPPTAVTSGNT